MTTTTTPPRPPQLRDLFYGHERVASLDVARILRYAGGHFHVPDALLPDMHDLAGLYHLVVSHPHIRTVVEIGAGYSTLVLAAALEDTGRPDCSLHSVEASTVWRSVVLRHLSLMPPFHRTYVTIEHSPARAECVRHTLACIHARLPDVTPDLIYLDGPDTAQVRGDVRGLTFGGHRVPVCADPLLYESTMLPGAMILVDGRTTNARWLETHLRRSWTVVRATKEHDVTLFRLAEPPLWSQREDAT